MIDHVPKSTDSQRFALGSQHKTAGLTGASYRFEAGRQLSRALVDPVEASVTIYVEKDRPGHVRAHQHANDKRIATMELTAYPDGGITIRLQPPGLTQPPSALVTAIAEHLAIYEGASLSNVEKAIGGNSTNLRAALAWMASPDRAWVEVVKVGQAHRHHLTTSGRTELLT